MSEQRWSTAWAHALYGPTGFYRTGAGADSGPAGHFRTSVHVGRVFAGAIADLLGQVDARLGHPDVVDLVDVGAGRGELAAGVLAELPASLLARVRAVAVDVRSRPPGLDQRVAWVDGAAPEAVAATYPAGVRGLLLAHELLDDLPCDVVEVDSGGTPRLVLVDPAGTESAGAALVEAEGDAGPDPVDRAAAARWLRRWWPVREPGERAEIGLGRDHAWAGLVASLAAGTALAVDYGHDAEQRRSGRHSRGTLLGYVGGRAVPPRPDASMDLTAHVAVDSCADAVRRRAGDILTLRRQRDALADLGVDGRLPPPAPGGPDAYAAALDRASQAVELRDVAGLGSFWWLRVDRPPT